MNANQQKKLSIRARVAYGIMCLESMLDEKQKTNEVWQMILSKLWEYTSIQYLDDWHEELAEYIPETLNDYTQYIEADFDFLAKNNFEEIKNTYSKCDEDVINLINLIFYTGTLELYGALLNDGEQSLEYLGQIVTILNTKGIKLPDLNIFSNYSFSEQGGWGNPFDKEELLDKQI